MVGIVLWFSLLNDVAGAGFSSPNWQRLVAPGSTNVKHELVQLAGTIDSYSIDREIAPLYNDKGEPARDRDLFVVGFLLLKHTYRLSDEGVCESWVYDPYFLHFSGEEFFQHEFAHERSDDLSY